MVDIFVFFVFLFFLCFSITRPYVAFCGFLWVDVFNPQKLSYGFLSTIPMSLSMAVICLLSIFLNSKKLSKPQDFKIIALLFLFAIWITITTYYSYFPIYAWFKWDVAIKIFFMTVLFCFVINTREQLELCFVVFALSASYYISTSGVKTLLGGGGYGKNLITGATNTGIAESSTLSMVAVMLLPMIFFLSKHTLLFTHFRNNKIIWGVPIVLIFACVVGSGARTGLVAFVVYITIKIMTSANKVRNILLLSLVAISTYSFLLSDDWKDRMSTIGSASSDSSATGRMLVWQWTFDFAKDHPIGGGFNAYFANAGLWQNYSDSPIVGGEKAKAFHSIYFEVMGEHGFIGLFIFLLIILLAWLSNRQVIKRTQYQDEKSWLHNCGIMLNHGIIIFCISGAFIGVAFQPFIYYYIAFSIILHKIAQNENAQLSGIHRLQRS